MKRILSILLTIVLLCAMCLLPCSVGAAENAASEARNGVVRILSVSVVKDKKGKLSYLYSTGSGFAVGEAGKPSAIFVTNKHVVEGAVAVYLLLDDAWYTEWIRDFAGVDMDVDMNHAVKCEVIYEPTRNPDYAILRAERVVTERVALPLMSHTLATPGDTVYTLGYPGSSDIASSASGGKAYLDEKPASIDSMTIAKGTISRFTTMASEGDANVIQTDAAIHSGNSGGPLINEQGYVIGINTWGANANGEAVYWSLSIDYVIERIGHLVGTGVINNLNLTVITDSESQPTENQIVTPQPVPTEPNLSVSDKKDPGNLWIILLIVGIVVVAAAAVAVIFMTKKKHPVAYENEPQPVPQTIAGNVPPVAFPVTMPVVDAIPATMPAYSTDDYRLLGEAGFFAGRRFALNQKLRLGRDPQKNDMVFSPDTAGVSGVHCVLEPAADGVSLTDLGSSYGTLLTDGTKLTPNKPVILKDGDGFYLGSRKQLFKIEKKNS